MGRFVRLARECPRVLPGGATRRLLAGEKMMLVLMELPPDAPVQMHSHSHEQIGFVLQGRVRFQVAGEVAELEPGDAYWVASGEQHGAQVVGSEPARLVEAFHPIREDFLE